MGGYKVQGKSLTDIEQLMRDAVALDRAGVACMVARGYSARSRWLITAEVSAPTIGIGAGPECDGQVLCFMIAEFDLPDSCQICASITVMVRL
jgi:3-methyl-2-oxobutanoate hydroxymethyltransferase